jgi:ubiquinone/menaquinone biosynthesis C-methylase UbiE
LRHYEDHYPRHAAAVRDQQVHPLFRSFNDRLAARVLDGGLPGNHSPGGRPVRLLEFGCGEGLLAAALSRVAAERGVAIAYTGSDLSPAALELAREYVDGEFEAGDATEVASALPPASQDLVVVKNLLHHLDDPGAFLREVARVAGPMGRVVIVEARLGCVPFFLVTFLFFNRRERHYFRGRNRNLVAPVAAAGLVVHHAERFSWFPFELAFAIRVGLFRQLFRTSNPRTLRRVADFDDRLARLMPWSTCYEIWTTASGADAGKTAEADVPQPATRT